MKTLALTAALALGLSAPAFANPQLEASLGVPAGVYTTAELIQLKDAAEKTTNEGRVFIGDSLGFAPAATVGAEQLAAAAGASTDRNVSELALIKDASERTSNEGSVFFGATSNSGAAQLAASLGIEFSGQSVADIALLKDAAEKTTNEGRVFLN